MGLIVGVGQGDYARGDGAGVGCRAGVRCTYYVAVPGATVILQKYCQILGEADRVSGL